MDGVDAAAVAACLAPMSPLAGACLLPPCLPACLSPNARVHAFRCGLQALSDRCVGYDILAKLVQSWTRQMSARASKGRGVEDGEANRGSQPLLRQSATRLPKAQA